MQQTSEKPRGRSAHSSHMNKRPPRLSQTLISAPDEPHMHAEQHPVDEIAEWGDWVSAEGGALDPTFVPPAIKKKGFAYQWIARSVLNAEDTIIQRRLTTFFRSGWKPVEGSRGVGYFTLPGEAVPATIVVGGLMLVEKPAYIEEHARKLNAQAARDQLTNKLEEVGLMSPENVRRKLVGHKVVGEDAIQTSAPTGHAEVPDA